MYLYAEAGGDRQRADDENVGEDREDPSADAELVLDVR